MQPTWPGVTFNNAGDDVHAVDSMAPLIAGAQRAHAQRRVGAEYELPQGLIDLASVCELLAADLPAPTARR